MKYVFFLILKSFLIFLFLFKLGLSQEVREDIKKEEAKKEPLLLGFILDKTKTKIGRDFYDAFVNLWEFPLGTENLNIIIDEQTDPRLGTQIFVYVEDTLVYHTILKPRLEDIDAKAEEAIQVVFNYFMNYLKYQKYLEEESKFM
ncbi:MAG: curli production assembly/transport protein CsgE [Thermodesulfobacteriaceae bacterium]|nr:curli production assembly/transport protein CsgE [Thermodesulfobacteriaceae bacterium]